MITDDGSPITVKLAQALTHQDSKVVVLSFPQTPTSEHLPLPEGVDRITLTDFTEAHLQQQIVNLMTTHGSLNTFIHLYPQLPMSRSGEPDASGVDKAILQHVFLLAKHLKQALVNRSVDLSGEGRCSFLSVAWLDGAFGLSRQTDFSVIAAGLFGLTKTLNHEWPAVFCRALDVSPVLSPDQAVKAILGELHDPDLRLTEVAYSTEGRSTLICDLTCE